MSRYTYAGPYQNPTTGWFVKEVAEVFQVWIRSERQEDGSCKPDRKHTSAPDFESAEEAAEYIDGLAEFYEEDYDSYLEENGPEIARMERYEMWRNEY